MDIQELKQGPDLSQNEALNKSYDYMKQLLAELRTKELKDEVVSAINEQVELINAIPEAGKDLKKQLSKSKSKITGLVEKEHKLVPKGYYRMKWMALGMTIFGLPIGLMFSMLIDNFAYLAIGLPIGMPIGMAVGGGMDQKAAQEGRQLNVSM